MTSMGKLQNYQAKIMLHPDAVPKFCKARTVPYAIQDRVHEELDRMEKSDIITKVAYSEWASLIVPVIKNNGDVRIGTEFKATINQHTNVDKHPLPTPEDLFHRLAGGQEFTVLDLSHAYNQVPLDEDSQRMTVTNTEQGLHAFKRLPFGAASNISAHHGFSACRITTCCCVPRRCDHHRYRHKGSHQKFKAVFDKLYKQVYD